MKKGNTDKVEVLKEDSILAWIDELAQNNKALLLSTIGISDWFCVGLLWGRVAPEGFKEFCLTEFRRTDPTPKPIELVLSGLSAQFFSDDLSFLENTSNDHLRLAKTLDPHEKGLLHWPNANLPILPEAQAAWIWSAEQLLKCKLPPQQMEELILLKEVYLYETDRQLWEKNKKTYQGLPIMTTTEVLTPVNNALPMLAGIPDQDRAEDILSSFRKNAPPWQNKEEAHQEWYGCAAYLLFEAFKAYEMTYAAEVLRSYVGKHLSVNPSNTKEKCLFALWENKLD